MEVSLLQQTEVNAHVLTRTEFDDFDFRRECAQRDSLPVGDDGRCGRERFESGGGVPDKEEVGENMTYELHMAVHTHAGRNGV